jgi:hypothetical protein
MLESNSIGGDVGDVKPVSADNSETMQYPEGHWLTATEACGVLCCQEQTLYQRICRKKIQAVKHKGEWLIRPESAFSYWSRRLGVPKLEDADPNISSLVSIKEALSISQYHPQYLRWALKNKKILSFVDTAGEIFISERSLRERLNIKKGKGNKYGVNDL